MKGTKVIILLCAILISCEASAIYKNKNKCSVHDNECVRDSYNSLLAQISDSGIPEAGIPAFDPYVINNYEVTIMGLVKFTKTEGTVKGFKTCHADYVNVDDIKQIVNLELSCEEYIVDGKYKIGTTPVLDTLIGGIKVYGDGQGILKLENVKIKVEAPFEFKKLSDCELHVVFTIDEITHTLQHLGKASMTADSLYIGKQEVSSVFVNIFNENWEVLFKAAEKNILDAIIQETFGHLNKYFAWIPAKDLFIDDLPPQVAHL